MLNNIPFRSKHLSSMATHSGRHLGESLNPTVLRGGAPVLLLIFIQFFDDMPNN